MGVRACNYSSDVPTPYGYVGIGGLCVLNVSSLRESVDFLHGSILNLLCIIFVSHLKTQSNKHILLMVHAPLGDPTGLEGVYWVVQVAFVYITQYKDWVDGNFSLYIFSCLYINCFKDISAVWLKKSLSDLQTLITFFFILIFL